MVKKWFILLVGVVVFVVVGLLLISLFYEQNKEIDLPASKDLAYFMDKYNPLKQLDNKVVYRSCVKKSFVLSQFKQDILFYAPEFTEYKVIYGKVSVLDENKKIIRNEPSKYLNANDLVGDYFYSLTHKVGTDIFLDPRILATLIEMNTKGLSEPNTDSLFPLGFDKITTLEDKDLGMQIARFAVDFPSFYVGWNSGSDLTKQQLVNYLKTTKIDFNNRQVDQEFKDIFIKIFNQDPTKCTE